MPPDQGNVLRASRQGGDVRLDFGGATASSWRLFRDPVKTGLGTTPLLPDATAATYVDAAALGRAGNDLYRVKGLSPCSLTPGP